MQLSNMKGGIKMIVRKPAITLKELIVVLQSFLDNGVCNGDVQILFGDCDMGNCVTNVFYNNSNTQQNAPWFGEFIVLNH